MRQFDRRSFLALHLYNGVYYNYMVESRCDRRAIRLPKSTIVITANNVRKLFKGAANSLDGAKRIATRLFQLNIPLTGNRVVRCRPAAIGYNKGHVLVDRTTEKRNNELFTVGSKGR